MIALEKLFDFVPLTRLEQLAGVYQIDARYHMRLPGPVVFLCLLNGLLNHPELSQRVLEETYHQQTGQRTDHSSWGKCLAKLPPAYFADLFSDLYAKLSPKITPATAQTLRLRRIDATTVTLSAKLMTFGLSNQTTNPDKTLRHVKSVVELSQDGLPQLLKVCKDKADKSDCVALGDTMVAHTQAGDLWIFDKGCHDRSRLLRLHQAGSFWLTPHSQQAFQQAQTLWEADPKAWPTQAPQEPEPDFVLTQVQQAVFGNSQETREEQACWDTMPLLLIHGVRFDKRRKQWLPLVFMTNLPLSADQQHTGLYTFAEIATLYRSRWDIEVFFKFIKQHLSYSHLLSRCENGITIMIYMSLIAALLLIWYKQQTGIDRGWRSVKFWLAEDCRVWTRHLLRKTPLVPDG